MCSKNLQHFSTHLERLRRAKGKRRKELLKEFVGDNRFVTCMSEICLNLLKGHLEVNKRQKTVLSRGKKQLRLLAARSTPLKKKKHILINQSGGFILPLLAAVGGALSSLLFNH